jgi:hypothetical protein
MGICFWFAIVGAAWSHSSLVIKKIYYRQLDPVRESPCDIAWHLTVFYQVKPSRQRASSLFPEM